MHRISYEVNFITPDLTPPLHRHPSSLSLSPSRARYSFRPPFLLACLVNCVRRTPLTVWNEIFLNAIEDCTWERRLPLSLPALCSTIPDRRNEALLPLLPPSLSLSLSPSPSPSPSPSLSPSLSRFLSFPLFLAVHNACHSVNGSVPFLLAMATLFVCLFFFWLFVCNDMPCLLIQHVDVGS